MRLENRGFILAASRSSLAQLTSVRLPARRRYSKIANGLKTRRTATKIGLADRRWEYGTWFYSGPRSSAVLPPIGNIAPLIRICLDGPPICRTFGGYHVFRKLIVDDESIA